MKETKILVIGSNGYMGRHLAISLHRPGIQIRCCDIHPESADSDKRFYTYEPMNILKTDDMKRIDLNVDFIFLLAGLTGTSTGFLKYEEFINVNEVGLLNVLNRLREINSNARIIFPSSRLVYRGKKDIKLKEDGQKEFKTIYAMNKFCCENYLKLYSDYFGIKYTIFRICVPYGNLMDNYSYGTIGFFLNRAKKGLNIVLYGDGSQKRTFTHIYDICQILSMASFLGETENDVFNVGGSDHLSLLQVASMVAEKYGVAVEFSEWPLLDFAIESGDTVFHSGKLDQLMDYEYKYSIKDWINSLD